VHDWTPRARARLTGVFELLEGTTSVVGTMVVPGMVVVSRDAAATANNILANEGLYRFGIAVAVSCIVFHVAWGLLLYELLRVVDRTVARFTLVLLAVGTAVQAVTTLLQIAPLVVLRSTEPLAAFTPEQLQDIALVFLRLNTQSNYVFLTLFGVWLVAIGWLVMRSTFLPRLIGIGLILEGVGWIAYIVPSVGLALFPVIAVFGVAGELALTFWLLVRGVDDARWREVAAAAR
jgi:hypothetical protein